MSHHFLFTPLSEPVGWSGFVGRGVSAAGLLQKKTQRLAGNPEAFQQLSIFDVRAGKLTRPGDHAPWTHGHFVVRGELLCERLL